MTRLDSRAALSCHEYLHKHNAPNLFGRTGLVDLFDASITWDGARKEDLHWPSAQYNFTT